MAWDRMHPRLTHRGPWLDPADEKLPVLHGTSMRVKVERLPGDRDPKPVRLWISATAALPADVNRWWQAFLRRFDLEHTFRLMKQTLGWTAPGIRHAESADLWTWLIIAAHTQLRLARPGASPPPGSGEGFGTSGWSRRPAPQPHRSRPGQDRGDLQARRTSRAWSGWCGVWHVAVTGGAGAGPGREEYLQL
ncbi:NF041680 family putative transposase, partial [Streptomyces sp. NPDC002913]